MIDSLTPGVTYKFKIQSRNQFSLSDDSQVFSILCATVPDIPLAPTTTQFGSDIKVTWSAPSANGSPITGYKVYLQQKSGAFNLESTVCPMNAA